MGKKGFVCLHRLTNSTEVEKAVRFPKGNRYTRDMTRDHPLDAAPIRRREHTGTCPVTLTIIGTPARPHPTSTMMRGQRIAFSICPVSGRTSLRLQEHGLDSKESLPLSMAPGKRQTASGIRHPASGIWHPIRRLVSVTRHRHMGLLLGFVFYFGGRMSRLTAEILCISNDFSRDEFVSVRLSLRQKSGHD